jgi:uroporphyrinogen-III decarboxylase
MVYPDEMHELVEYITDFEMEYAKLICEKLKPNMILHHDDWGSQDNSFLRPEMFEEFFVEPYKKVYGYYHDHGVEFIVHHSDSYGANLVPYMIEMGIDVWQGPMETNNVAELVKQYQGKITFMGDIDNKDVDFTGWTPADTGKTVRRSIDSVNSLTSYIPCITQGGPGSVFPGRYRSLLDEIALYNQEKFGFPVEEQFAMAPPAQILFGEE